MTLDPSPVARFGTFAFELRQRLLTRNGEIVPLPLKDLEILHLLIESHGQILEKKVIIEKVWPDTFVEEANVSRHVFNLRQILSENGERSIETVPKRGYRFVAPVRFAPVADASHQSAKSDVDLNETWGLQASQAGESMPVASTSENNERVRARSAGKVFFQWRTWALAFAALLAIGAMFDAFTLLGAKVRHPLVLAVLPMQNLTGNSSYDYVSDGLPEEMITQAGMLSSNQLRVIPRTSSMVYKATAKSAADISRELGTDYLMEGSLREAGGRFRITISLIGFPEEQYIWVHEFDRTPTNLISMEDDVSQSVAKSLADLIPSAPKALASARRQP